jgi:tRNA-dihydrouridine synthase A
MKKYHGHKIAIAPMMDWTDRHCRVFHRRLTRHALLHTEMIVADAVIYGDRARLLGFAAEERPLALQLAGADPIKLALAAAIGADLGFDEINLNVGCPSERVRSGTFGACLMRTPELVGDCIAAMVAAVPIPVTVKCRLGVDEQDPVLALDAVADQVFAAGAAGLWVHARKAWLAGLSPQENREVPPLDHARVYRLKRRHPDRFIGINGGIRSLDEAARHLAQVDGVMLGRAAYETPAILADVDHRFYGGRPVERDLRVLAADMAPYAEEMFAKGGRLSHLTRHMLGLFHGRPGARHWRQALTVGAADPRAGVDVLFAALAHVEPRSPTAAEAFPERVAAA